MKELLEAKAGSLPPILMLHGVMSRASHFHRYQTFFAQRGFTVYASNFRGRLGIPPRDAEGVRLRDYLEDASRFLSAMPEPPLVFGHSMGSLIAQKLAEAGGIKGLVLLSPVPPGRLRLPPLSLASSRLFLETAPYVLRGEPVKVSMAALRAAAMPLVPEDRREQVYSEFAPESGLVYRDLVLGLDMKTKQVSCPVLCISGDRDRLCPPRMTDAVARLYGGERFVYAGMDHWLLDEPGWERPAADIEHWIQTRIR